MNPEANADVNEGTLDERAQQRLNAALEYHARGFALIPLTPGGKEPAFALLPPFKGKGRWQPLAVKRADEEQIRSWFEQLPEVSVGVICGAISGNLVVVDVDRPARMKGLPLTPSPRANTPSGGYHAFYRSMKRVKKKKFCAGDIIGEGGYVALPLPGEPGRHWMEYLGIDHEITKAPGWVYRVKGPKRVVKKRLTRVCKEPQKPARKVSAEDASQFGMELARLRIDDDVQKRLTSFLKLPYSCSFELSPLCQIRQGCSAVRASRCGRGAAGHLPLHRSRCPDSDGLDDSREAEKGPG